MKNEPIADKIKRNLKAQKQLTDQILGLDDYRVIFDAKMVKLKEQLAELVKEKEVKDGIKKLKEGM